MTAETLFPEPLESPEQTSGHFAAVAVEDSLDKLLDYSIPQRLLPSLRIGQRVRVPLGRGNRPAHGYVIALRSQTEHAKTKPLLAIDDERVLLNPRMMELARWMSRYYVAPLGTVIDSVIPSAVKKKVGLGYVNRVRLAMPRAAVQEMLEKTKAPKRRAILACLLQVEPEQSVDLVHLASESGATPATVRKLTHMGVITIASEVDLPGLTSDIQPSAGSEVDIALNEDQQRVLDELVPRLKAAGEEENGKQGDRETRRPGEGDKELAISNLKSQISTSLPAGFSVNLLHGVTGSGKTEVYLQCIRRVVEQGRQAIVLVPEIALTPQTVRRFTARFKRVAVLHSGLGNSQRHRYWQMIATGQADVVVGARSAVFAPLPRLGIIVVDEEHEPSYKQDTAPRYHGRDVAIKRAQIENVPILLGSATPSLETYWRVRRDAVHVTSSPYSLLSLPNRVRGLAMPHVELIDMKQEMRMRRGVHLLSQRLEHLLQTTTDSGHQAILLLNRRGYSNFVYCASCQQATQCKYCDATMTYHRSAAAGLPGSRTEQGLHTGQLHCHYCLAVSPLPAKCPTCGKLLSLFGLGTQRVEEELVRKFPKITFARVDSDTMRSGKDYEALLGRFARKEIQVMLGTQMIAKGLDYPNVTLVGVISGDTALALPDFRAAERTFQLITQVAGRAGRGDAAGRVVLQTFLPDDPTIQAAIRQDFTGFAQTELAHRREVGLPPFARMCRIILRDEDVDKLHNRAEELASEITQIIATQAPAVQLKGPMPCAIARIAGYFRYQIVLYAPSAEPLQRVLADAREHKHLANGQRVAVDVDPVSLL